MPSVCRQAQQYNQDSRQHSCHDKEGKLKKEQEKLDKINEQKFIQGNEIEKPRITKPSLDRGEKSIDLLEGIASINLVISLIVGFIMLVTVGFSSIEYEGYFGFIYTKTVANPLYIFFSLVIILEGVIVYAFLNVIASMGTNLIAIRKNTEKK